MKCLEKDPARRYATANDLAADIVRHLNNEPVVARPAGQIHRFQKLVRRNKAVASAVVVTVLSLIAGLVVSTRSWLEERAALRVAVAAQQEQSRLRQEAEKAALKSQATAQFLQDVLAGAEPRIASGRDSSLLLELVDNAAQRASDELTNQPDVESDVKMTIGFVYQGLQQNYKAEAVFRSVLDLRTKVFGSNSVQAAAAMVPLGFLCDWASDGMSMHTPAEAERWGRRALEIQEKHGATDPQLLASTCELLADTLSREGVSHFPEAEQLARRAVALNENVLTNKASFTANDPAYSLDVLARVFFHEKKYSDAEAAFRRVAGIYQQKGDKVETCWADYFLLQVLEDETKYSEAEPVGAGLLQMWEKLEGVESLPFAESAARLGECFYNDGKLAEAVAAERQALASAEKIRSKVNVDALCEESESILGCALKQQGKLAEAEAIERQALALARKINDPAGDTLQWPLINLGGVLNAERHFPEAEVLIREALSNTRKRTDSPIVGPEIKWGDTELGIALEGQGKLAEAEQMFRNAYSVTQRMWPNEPARWQLDSNILNGFLTSHPKAR
jgi:tetratricopeptide (TPR) repeat protein